MGIGVEIRRLRMRTGHSQRALAEAAGVAVAYLSRIENERVTPSLRALGRLAGAMEVDVAVLLKREMPLEPPDRCPVSVSGRCVLDGIALGRGRRPVDGRECYRPEDLEALRLCNVLLQRGSRNVSATITMVLKGLLALGESHRSMTQTE